MLTLISTEMRRRFLITIFSLVFLFGFLTSQVIVFGINHHISVSNHKHEGKSSCIAEKCRICDIQSHNNIILHYPEEQSFTSEISDEAFVFEQSYRGIKLIKSSSRSPPAV
jgi:hypothetical protein